MSQAIEKHARVVEGVYAVIKNVAETPMIHEACSSACLSRMSRRSRSASSERSVQDKMETFFLDICIYTHIHMYIDHHGIRWRRPSLRAT